MILKNVYNKISPFWPLRNLVACNPLWGFVGRKFEDVLKNDANLFRIKNLPPSLEELNLHTLKYLQAFFDDFQAIIKMPNKEKGLLNACLEILIFDKRIINKANKNIILTLPLKTADSIIEHCLSLLNIKNPIDKEKFLLILLTTLSGWSSFVKYKSEWESENPSLEIEFLALRLLLFTLISSDWQSVLNLKLDNVGEEDLKKIKMYEEKYRKELFNNLSFNKIDSINSTPDAQFVFCIDIRSEQIRRKIESNGNYETFGFAGFFGIPIKVTNHLTQTSYSSCPVFLKGRHNIEINTNESLYTKLRNFKKYLNALYDNFKYNFTTPMLLIDFLGFLSILRILSRILGVENYLRSSPEENINISEISLQEKVKYAYNFLSSIGLVHNFAKKIIICGHESKTKNNTFATALDCGACGGRSGRDSSKVAVEIMNDKNVRFALKKDYKIEIPDRVVFFSALHNTTTNSLTFYNDTKIDLSEFDNLLLKTNEKKSKDWSETRPEWGLAKNASFIIGPRDFTKNVNLEGRSFLHSYDYKLDFNGEIIKSILTGPLIVGHWINSQYLFSTIDNIAFGAGSKITHNIIAKNAVIQGNGSDIMHGLPLQSVSSNDSSIYHEPIRLTAIIYGSKDLILKMVNESDVLRKLFANEWLFLICFDLKDSKRYILNSELKWDNL